MHASCLIFFWKKLSIYFHAKIPNFWDGGTVFPKHSGPLPCGPGLMLAFHLYLNRCFSCRLGRIPPGRGLWVGWQLEDLGSDFSFAPNELGAFGQGENSLDLTLLVLKYERKLLCIILIFMHVLFHFNKFTGWLVSKMMWVLRVQFPEYIICVLHVCSPELSPSASHIYALGPLQPPLPPSLW